MKRLCRNCATFYDRKLDACPRCGTPAKNKNNNTNTKYTQTNRTSEMTSASRGGNNSTNLDENLDKMQSDKLSNNNALVEDQFEKKGNLNNENSSSDNTINKAKIKWIPKHKRLDESPKDIRESGIHIDVSDVSFFDKRGAGSNKYKPKTGSAKTHTRKDYELEKLKWWEIYRWADRVLARRKIKKYVNKEAIKKPENISYTAMLVLTIFTGYMGFNHIYAKNYGRGFSMFGMFSIAFGIVALIDVFPWLSNVELSLGGGFAAIVLLMWFWDIVRIIFRKFKYRESKLAYISTLDVETRARLGKKYI